MLEFLYRPQPGVSYDFIFVCYSISIIICGILFAVESVYKVDTIKGFWIVFSPFLPCWIWALWMKARAAKESSPIAAKKKGE
jgi:hypothetical protein